MGAVGRAGLALVLVAASAAAAYADEAATWVRARSAAVRYWQDRDPAQALIAARAFEEASAPAEAAAYWWIYLNTAELEPGAAASVIERIAALHQTRSAPTTAPEPAPAPAPAPAAELQPAPRAAEPAAPRAADADPERLPPPRAAAAPRPQLPRVAVTVTREPGRRAYGGKLAIADVTGLSVIVIGAGSDSGGAVFIGVIGLLLAIPVIHGVHPGGGSGLLGLVLRGAGAGIGGAAGGEAGAVGGYLAAALLDDALLARYTPERRRRAPKVSPLLVVDRQRAVAGIGMEF